MKSEKYYNAVDPFPGIMKAKTQSKIKGKGEYIKFVDVPRTFMEETGYMLADYSVALGYFENERDSNPVMFGSGVFVKRGNRFGILTAHHCVHFPGPDLELGQFGGHRLALVLKRSNRVIVPPEVVQKHALAVPDQKNLEPDLAFLEFFPCPLLSSLRAIACFWSLDAKHHNKAKKFSKIGTPFVVIGFPGVYQQKIPSHPPRHLLKHMTYFYAITKDGKFQRGDWDYLEANNYYGEGNDKNLPQTFGGVSGGPVWGLHIRREKVSSQLKIKDFCLVGTAFLERRQSKKELRIRAHFIESIYDKAWEAQN